MRFHILGLPHTVTSSDYNACAFTQKILKLCRMLHDAGHTVFHYGHARSVVDCTEHVAITDDTLLNSVYGEYNWKRQFFKWDESDEVHKQHQDNAIVEIGNRKQPHDFLLLIWCQTRVADAHKDLIVVDPGIGTNRKPWAPFNVYESYAVMHSCYAKANVQPHWYDCVIPNYYDVRDFTFEAKKQDYLLFLARVTHQKGLAIAVEVAKRTGKRLLVAGQGDVAAVLGKEIPDCVEVVGYADVEKRRELMSNACALIQASHYNEPFGGCVVEAMLSGTPVITSDWGAFSETVLHGTTGYRCRTIEQFVWAVRNIDRINPYKVHQWATQNYSTTRVLRMYEEFFAMLMDVKRGGGFYAENDKRENLEWLVRYT